nr:immunoglobulin light chain junction region [Macaca mulatta]MOW60513.1 immunoglobulin light chain junction region [Macaca mulatta]
DYYCQVYDGSTRVF